MTDGILQQCFANSVYASFMVLAVLVIRRLFQGRVPHKYVCALWLLVLLRLILPVSLEADFGVLPETSEILTLFEGPIGIHNAFRAAGHNTKEAGVIPNNAGSAEISEVSDKNKQKAEADSTQDIISERHTTHWSVLSVLWLSGSGLLLLYMVLGMLLTGRRLRFAVPELYRISVNPSDAVQRNVKVYLDENVEVPFLYGLMKPRIYLPCGLPREEAEHVIRHELAHIRRCDQVWKPLYFIVLSFYWYNPFVWIAFLMFSTDMELACDEAVAGVYDEDLRKRYVQTLLSVAGNNKGMGLLTLPFGKAPIVYRIKEIVNYKKKGATGRFFGVLVILIMTLVFSTVRVSAGFDPAEIADYSLVIPLADEESRERYLLVPYSRDPNAYELLSLDESLETEVRENSDEFWYERPLSDYTIRQNEAKGLEYIVKNQHAVWEGHVLLRNERDARKYDALAGDYAELFKEIIPERDIGYIYADYEVKGLGGRLKKGFWFLQTGTLMYIDLDTPPSYGWRLGLTSEEYMRLERQLSENGTPTFDASDFNAWKPLLDELAIEYDFALDPESARYRGAVEWLAKMRGGSWAEGMSEEQKEEQIRYTIKSFDEDGDEVPFMSVPGMLITDENAADRRTIIPIPEEIRQRMFDLNKEEFLKWNGMSVDTERSSVYRAYQEQVPKKDRLKGTWTLGQYERIYNRYFAEAVKESDPGWQAGEDFNPAVLASITREEIEQYISSDGAEFTLQKD